MEKNFLNIIASLSKWVMGTKISTFLVLQDSNIWKIGFISVCFLIIISAIIVLLIKIKMTEKKKRERK